VIRSLFPVLCCRDLDASRDFYRAALGLEVVFECGWYTVLAAPGDPSRQVAFVLPDHESVPAPFGVDAAGVLVTVEVDDAERVHERAVGADLPVVVPFRDEEFGQRHFMTRDPSGLLLDVVQTTRPTTAFLREVARWRRAHR